LALVYPSAHAKATNQPGQVNETLYDGSGKVLQMTPSGGYPNDKKGNKTIIQKLP
jgi:hypothetical protein